MSDRNNYTDPLDNAAEAQDAANRAGIARARAAANQKPPEDFDGESCVECGLTIPQQRLDLGKFTCVGCQTRIEKRQKGY